MTEIEIKSRIGRRMGGMEKAAGAPPVMARPRTAGG
jgi:hypothetical protein